MLMIRGRARGRGVGLGRLEGMKRIAGTGESAGIDLLF